MPCGDNVTDSPLTPQFSYVPQSICLTMSSCGPEIKIDLLENHNITSDVSAKVTILLIKHSLLITQASTHNYIQQFAVIVNNEIKALPTSSLVF